MYLALLNQHRQKALNFQKVFIKFQETELSKKLDGSFKVLNFSNAKKTEI
jgi:hypothetical protein